LADFTSHTNQLVGGLSNEISKSYLCEEN